VGVDIVVVVVVGIAVLEAYPNAVTEESGIG
jgi:hypothetical protein